MRRAILIFFAVPIIVFTIGITALWSQQNRFVYQAPDHSSVSMKEGWELEKIPQSQSDDLLSAYYRRAQPGMPTVVFFHGSAGSYQTTVWSTQDYADKGWGILMPEYPGYGGNPGAPSETSFKDAAVSAMAWIKNQGVDEDDLVVIGNSIGSGPAITAAKQGAGGLVVISGLTSLKDVVKEKLPSAPTYLLRDRYENARDIQGIALPVLIVHGEDDEIIPFSQGRQLASISGGELLTIPDGDHAVAYRGETQMGIIQWVNDRVRR